MECPGGHEHDPIVKKKKILAQYLRGLFGAIFFKILLERDCNGKKDRCAVFGCNNDHRFVEKYMVKEHTSFFRGTFLLLQGTKALGYLDETTEPEGI